MPPIYVSLITFPPFRLFSHRAIQFHGSMSVMEAAENPSYIPARMIFLFFLSWNNREFLNISFDSPRNCYPNFPITFLRLDSESSVKKLRRSLISLTSIRATDLSIYGTRVTLRGHRRSNDDVKARERRCPSIKIGSSTRRFISRLHLLRRVLSSIVHDPNRSVSQFVNVLCSGPKLR